MSYIYRYLCGVAWSERAVYCNNYILVRWGTCTVSCFFMHSWKRHQPPSHKRKLWRWRKLVVSHFHCNISAVANIKNTCIHFSLTSSALLMVWQDVPFKIFISEFYHKIWKNSSDRLGLPWLKGCTSLWLFLILETWVINELGYRKCRALKRM